MKRLYGLQAAAMLTLFAPAARTETANGIAIDLNDYDGPLVVLAASALGTGTTPTLAITLEDSDDNSTFGAVTEYTSVAVTDAAAVANKQVIDTSALKRYVRAVVTIGGDTPSFACAVLAFGVKKAMP